MAQDRPVLITGAGGHVGRALLRALPAEWSGRVTATDLSLPSPEQMTTGVTHARRDVTDAGAVDAAIVEAAGGTVIHLASIVTPPRGSSRELEYAVDVLGTRNVLDACLKHGVRRIVVTSSGAAYGYHADNPSWLTEERPLRGNDEFAYARHKRLAEEMLASARKDHPELEQVVLRVGTVLGKGLENQITALFRRPRLIRIAGSESPFVFVWDEDLANILLRAASDGPAGIYNVAGDGALSVREIAVLMGRPVMTLPAWALAAALALGRRLGMTRYGPEQVRFLRYRPVLDNTRLKTVFGYRPEKSSREAFEAWARHSGLMR
jgi:UDP-glucose 4-epimerase